MTRPFPWFVSFLTVALSACASPAHLQYDHGRSYAEAFNRQADLTRASVATEYYTFTGVEGLELRKRVEEATTEAKSGKGSDESSGQ